MGIRGSCGVVQCGPPLTVSVRLVTGSGYIIAAQVQVVVWGETFTALMLGEGYWLAGAYDSARQTLEALLDPAEPHGMLLILASAHRLLEEVALTTNPAQREAPLAATHFERSIAILQQIGAENELALTYAGHGRLHQQQGDLAGARYHRRRGALGGAHEGVAQKVAL